MQQQMLSGMRRRIYGEGPHMLSSLESHAI